MKGNIMLLDRKRVGLLIRVFSLKQELVSLNVEKIIKAVERARVLTIGKKSVFSRVDILVSADIRYLDSDCGETAKALRTALTDLNITNVHVHEIQKGDIFCGVLNYGVAHHLRERIDYSTILSSEATSYLNEETMTEVLNALEKGALVAGVAIDEISESIMEGRIANTFATWNNTALMSVGGFDLRARKPRKDEKLTCHLRGWSEAKEVESGDGEVFYHLAGVEEIIPQIRLVELYGECLAPLHPCGNDHNVWVKPDPAVDPDGYKRYLKKLGTKTERQAAFAAMENADLSFIKGGVMKEYRTF